MGSRWRIPAIAAAIACGAAAWLLAANRAGPGAPAVPPDPGRAIAVPAAPSPATGPGDRSPATGAPIDETESPTKFPEGGELLRGEVILASGRRAAGARVLAWGLEAITRGEPAVVAGRGKADSDGRVVIAIPPIEGRLVVYAAMPGLQSSGALVPAGRPREEFRIVLGRGGILIGTLFDADGAAVPRHEVRLWPARRWLHEAGGSDWRAWSAPGIWEEFGARTTTDASGGFRFEGLPLPRGEVPQPVTAVAIDGAGRAWRTEEVAIHSDAEVQKADLRMGETGWSGDAKDAPPFDPIVTGVVLDAASGEPVPDAHAIFVADIGESSSWWGTTTDAEGRFRIDAGRFRPGYHRLEVRVAAEDRRTWRGAFAGPGMEIRMERLPGRPAPGRIRGVAQFTDGRAVEGVVEATLLDEMLHSESRNALADRTGTFLLAGVLPGQWRVRLRGCRSWSTVVVPEGGESAVAFRVDRPPDPLPPWTEAAAEELELLDRQAMLLVRGAAAASGSGEDSEAIDRKLEQSLREIRDRCAVLEETRRAAQPRRAVEVTGLPEEPYATLEASSGGRRWVEEVAAGRAGFPGLEIGEWRFTLRRRVAVPEVRQVEVVAGDGPLVLEFGAAR